MGVMLSAAGSLTWLRDATGSDTPFDVLLGEADAWPAGTENLLFLPYLAGERTPYADPDARGAFVGLSIRHDRGALTRAVLEGVAFALRDSLDLTRELGGVPALGRISGGGARSALWTRIIASVLELPLEPGGGGRGRGVRRGDPRRSRGRTCGRTSMPRSPPPSNRAPRSSPWPSGSRSIASSASTSGRCTRAQSSSLSETGAQSSGPIASSTAASTAPDDTSSSTSASSGAM